MHIGIPATSNPKRTAFDGTCCAIIHADSDGIQAKPPRGVNNAPTGKNLNARAFRGVRSGVNDRADMDAFIT